IQSVSDWMGDHGDLVRMSTQLRRPNLVGDTNTVHGQVVDVREEQGIGLVDVRVAVVNHTGAETAVGRVTVRLPRRGERTPHEALFAPAAVDDTASVYG